MRHSLLPEAQRSPHYGALLAVLVLLIVVSPLSTGPESELVVEAFLDLVFVTGAYAAAARKGNPWPFILLTAATLLWRWGALLFGQGPIQLGAIAITILWMGMIVGILVKSLFEQRDVDTNMIFAAVIVYLFAGVFFAFVFELLEVAQPGSFSGIPDGGHPREQGNALVYFSFVCLTTMGYGDIVPVSNLARPLSVLEGVFGALYLAVMIARLVGLHTQSEHDR
jgi:hypothetical protein